MSEALPGGTTPKLNLTDLKLEKILDPAHPLCKEEVVWMLEFIKKRWLRRIPSLRIFPSHAFCKTFVTLRKSP
ncbi:hypothetical protein LJK88_21135 [Paenibacillus sp. P26]|nr:hypothetical protein LJK88_21135 [Paenibacillus sp. P26]UUZ95883.1 hypothetical protein LJK87_16750 [Paenibacillus sp. P25]